MFPYAPFPEDEDEPPWDITVDPSVVDEIRKRRKKEKEEKKKERAEVERHRAENPYSIDERGNIKIDPLVVNVIVHYFPALSMPPMLDLNQEDGWVDWLAARCLPGEWPAMLRNWRAQRWMRTHWVPLIKADIATGCSKGKTVKKMMNQGT